MKIHPFEYLFVFISLNPKDNLFVLLFVLPFGNLRPLYCNASKCFGSSSNTDVDFDRLIVLTKSRSRLKQPLVERQGSYSAGTKVQPFSTSPLKA